MPLQSFDELIGDDKEENESIEVKPTPEPTARHHSPTNQKTLNLNLRKLKKKNLKMILKQKRLKLISMLYQMK